MRLSSGRSQLVAHRRGRRTSFLDKRGWSRASVAELLDVAADPAARREVAESARFVVLTTDGERDLDAAEFGRRRHAELLAVRRPVSYPRMPNYIGRFSAPDGAGGWHGIWFESLNELSHMRDLMLTTDVKAMSSQAVLVGWKLPSGYRFHFPDLLVTAAHGGTTVVDVTRVGTLTQPAALAQFGLMAATAAALGWSFEVRTELPQQRRVTQSHVYACRHFGSEDRIDAGERQLPMRAWAGAFGGGAAGVAQTLALIARRRLFIAWDEPLEPDTAVSTAPLGSDTRPWKVSFE